MNEEQNVQNAKAQMRKGTLEFCVLLVVAKDKVYASDILDELKAANLIVVEGTIYPILSRLKASGLVSYSWEESKEGPPRKYYALTEKGRETLSVLEENWKSLSGSINSLLKK